MKLIKELSVLRVYIEKYCLDSYSTAYDPNYRDLKIVNIFKIPALKVNGYQYVMDDFHLYVKHFQRNNTVYLKCRTDNCKSTYLIKDNILIIGSKRGIIISIRQKL